MEATLPSNPHIQYFDGFHRGYIYHEVNGETWTANYFGVRDARDAASEVYHLASFSVESGVPGAVAS